MLNTRLNKRVGLTTLVVIIMTILVACGSKICEGVKNYSIITTPGLPMKAANMQTLHNNYYIGHICYCLSRKTSRNWQKIFFLNRKLMMEMYC